MNQRDLYDEMIASPSSTLVLVEGLAVPTLADAHCALVDDGGLQQIETWIGTRVLRHGEITGKAHKSIKVTVIVEVT